MRLRVFTEPQQGATYDQQVAAARAAEAAGYDGYFRSDHYLVIAADGGGDGLPGPTDTWVTLAGLARETQRIRLGSLMTSATFRLPGPLAIGVAEVDAMSGGRIELGIGAGWFAAEHAAYAMPFPPVGERFDRLSEQLDVITGLWTTPVGERFSYAGRYYQVRDSPALPKPVQQPHPPILVGGHGARRTPALAARHAAEFNVGFSPVDVVGAQFDRVKAACGEIGRDPASIRYSAALVVCCGRDDREVARRAAAIGREVAELKEHGVAGTPDEAVATLARYAAIGTQTAYLQVLDLGDLDHIDLVAERVMPAVAGL